MEKWLQYIAPGLSVKGVISHYKSCDVAVLNPYLTFDKNERPRIVHKDIRIEDPKIPAESDCKTLEEHIGIYVKVPKSLKTPKKRGK